jgi:aminoglycoside phosphotransferase (APT) family kinase protein
MAATAPTTAWVDELGARMSRRLAADGVAGAVGELTPLPGGHSGLTYRARAGEQALVVKVVPPGRRPVGRHDVVRQARILAVLRDSGVPVPRLFAVDETEPAWFAMALVPGEAVEPVLDGVELAAGLARQRAVTAARTLARLHAVQPPAEPATTLPEELAKWDRVLHAGSPEFVEPVAALGAALSRRVPEPEPAGIVHGDYRLGNILFEHERPRAIVDWEIWGVGDPRVDLGYFGVFADAANFPEIGTAVPDLPTADELVHTYAQARGAPVTDSAWFAALGRFRMAAIMAHNLRRHREGRHVDEAQETLPATIHRLADTGLRVLGRGA